MEAVGAIFLIIGYMVSTSVHRTFAVWIFFLAAILIIGGAPLSRTPSILLILVALSVACWLTWDSWTSVTHISTTRTERPYVWVTDFISYLDDQASLDRGIAAEVVVENSADVPAFNAHSDAQYAVSEREFIKLADMPTEGLLTFNPDKDMHSFIGSKGRFVIDLPDSGPFDETLIPMIEKGENAFFYVFGTIYYEGAPPDKIGYKCEFCALYDPKKKLFFPTPFHNKCE